MPSTFQSNLLLLSIMTLKIEAADSFETWYLRKYVYPRRQYASNIETIDEWRRTYS
jgi:hypothetical protein